MPSPNKTTPNVGAKNNQNTIIVAFLALLVVTTGTYYFLTNNTAKKIAEPIPSPQAQPKQTLSEKEIEDSISTVPPMEQDLDIEFSETIRPPVKEGANLMLGSNQKIYQVGEEVSATLLVNTKVVIDGVEFEINYDPTMLANVSLETINSFGEFLGQKVKQEDGKITGIFLRDPNEDVDISKALPLLTITGTTTKTGQLNFAFDTDATTIAGAGGQEILENSYDLMVEVK